MYQKDIYTYRITNSVTKIKKLKFKILSKRNRNSSISYRLQVMAKKTYHTCDDRIIIMNTASKTYRINQ